MTDLQALSAQGTYVLEYANGYYREARRRGLSHRASRLVAAVRMRERSERGDLEAALPHLKRLGVGAYGIARRALRRM